MTNPWKMTPLGRITDIRVSNVDKKFSPAERPVRLCNYMDVYANTYVTAGLDFMEASASPSEIDRFALARGDVVITKDSETPDDIGVPAVIVDDIKDLVCGYHLALIRPDPKELDSVYLAKQLTTARVARFFAQRATGSTRYGLPTSAIESVTIPTPPKPEQEKLADVLTTVDRAIKETERLVAKQERIQIALMQDLLTRGIDQHGNLRSESVHHFSDSDLGKIPSDWRVASVGELFEQRRERGKPGLPVMSVVMEHGLVERASVERRVESNLPPEGHALVLRGDITYNMMRMWQGVLGRAHFDCLVSPAYVVLKPRPNIDSCFAEWLFRDARAIQRFRRASRGVVDDRLRLYPHDLFAIKFAVPKSPDEQAAIGQRLEAVKAGRAAETAGLAKLRLLRAGLMHDLLTGRKRVTPLLKAASHGLERVV